MHTCHSGAGRRRVLATFLTAVLVAATGCGGDDSGGTGGSDGGEEPVDVTFVVSSIGNEFWIAIKKGAEAQAKEMGAGVDLTVTAASNDQKPEENIAKVEDALAKQVDALAIVPNLPEQYVPVLTRVIQADIPLILAGIDIPSLEGITSSNGTNELEGGKIAGQFLADALPSGAKLGVLQCLTGNPTSDARVAGMNSAIAGSGIELVTTLDAKCDRERGRSVMADMLNANPDLDAVFSVSDGQTLGAIRAIDQAGKELVVASYDAQPEAVKEVINGRIDATVAQFPEKMGAEAVKAAVGAARGEKVPRNINTGVDIVTKDNAEEFLAESE